MQLSGDEEVSDLVPERPFAIEQSADGKDYVAYTAKESIAGRMCAVLGCLMTPLKKCSICPTHYCETHIQHHFHRMVPR
jgi:hypothetical protein